MYCPECGTSNDPDAEFCRECGEKLTKIKENVNKQTGTENHSNNHDLQSEEISEKKHILVYYKKYGLIALLALILIAGAIYLITSDAFSQINTPSMKVYNNTTAGLSFTYPSNWEELPAIQGRNNVGYVVRVGNPETRMNDTVNPVYGNVTMDSTLFLVGTSSKVLSLSSYYQFERNNLAKINTTQIISEKNITIDGVSAYEMDLKASDNKYGSFYYRIIYLEKGDLIYELAMSAKSDVYEKENTNFDAILKSFKFT